MLIPAVAHADDPNDPAMRDPRTRAHDREVIRQLNLKELQQVHERDARYAEGWRAYGEQGDREESYQRARSDYERQMDDYQQRRADYERDRAAWRHAVDACEAGQYEYCEH
ncbi:MAG: hypothetical protein KGM49_02385 [Sphingomonadales bacterium]|nr:hypothetical protein [Sphingomonadales bacterium]